MLDAQQATSKGSVERFQIILVVPAIIIFLVGVGSLQWFRSAETCDQTETVDTTGLVVSVSTTESCGLTAPEATLVSLPFAVSGFLAVPLIMRKAGLTKAGGLERQPSLSELVDVSVEQLVEASVAYHQANQAMPPS